MSLELARFPVTRARWGGSSAWLAGELVLDREELRAVVLGDPQLQEVAFELTHPRDSARINRTLDVLEPRTKVIGEGVTFPGIDTQETSCGTGRTNCLTGFAIVNSATFRSAGENMLGSQQDAIIDMTPERAYRSPFAQTINLVCSYGSVGDDDEAFDQAIRRASVRLARCLAGLTHDAIPEVVDTYPSEVTGDPSTSKKRIAYAPSVISIGPLLDTFFYGVSALDLEPRWVSSAELLDGAVVSGDYHYAAQRTPTYLYQNSPVIEALHRRQDDGIQVSGVVLSVKKHSEEDKRANASEVLRLLQERQVDGVCTHPAIGGNAQLDAMYIVQECERAGIAAGIIVQELGGAEGDDFGLVDFVPEANLIISSGNRDEPTYLAQVDRVLGSSAFLLAGGGSVEKLTVDTRLLCAGTTQSGALPLSAIEV